MKIVEVGDFEREFDSLLEKVERAGETIQGARDGLVIAVLRPVLEYAQQVSDAEVSAPTSAD